MLNAVCTGSQVQELKESRLTIRGDEEHILLFSREVWTGPGIVPTALLIRVQHSRRDLYITFGKFFRSYSDLLSKEGVAIYPIIKPNVLQKIVR